MKIGPLTLFNRQNCNGKPCNSWTVAALHWKWSLTWRWAVTWRPGLSGRIGFYFFRVYRSQGFNFHCGANFPIIGSVSLQTQPNMKL